MGYRCKVALATDKKSKEKIEKLLNKLNFNPSRIIELPQDEFVLCWDWVKWYRDIKEIDIIHNAIQELTYYDYSILGEDGAYEEYHGEDAPYVLGLDLCYWNVNKNIVL